MVLGHGTVIGIVLDIQSNRSLGQTIDNGKRPGGALGHPEVLKVKENGNVGNASEPESWSGKLAATTDNLEHFTLDFAFKLGVKLVSVGGREYTM